MADNQIKLYWTTFPATRKIHSDISRIKHILTSKKIDYEDIDLSQWPHRRQEMLANSNGRDILPQLHVKGRLIGSVDEIQEFEDWGELDAILRGVSPSKLAADALETSHKEYQIAGLIQAPPLEPPLHPPRRLDSDLYYSTKEDLSENIEDIYPKNDDDSNGQECSSPVKMKEPSANHDHQGGHCIIEEETSC